MGLSPHPSDLFTPYDFSRAANLGTPYKQPSETGRPIAERSAAWQQPGGVEADTCKNKTGSGLAKRTRYHNVTKVWYHGQGWLLFAIVVLNVFGCLLEPVAQCSRCMRVETENKGRTGLLLVDI